MAFGWHIEIGLFKYKRHTQHSLPKVNACLAISPNHSYVMDALALDLLHDYSF
jgi:hypothetical protein